MAYEYYVINKQTGRAVAAADYREDAQEMREDLPLPKSQTQVLTAAGMRRKYGKIVWESGRARNNSQRYFSPYASEIVSTDFLYPDRGVDSPALLVFGSTEPLVGYKPEEFVEKAKHVKLIGEAILDAIDKNPTTGEILRALRVLDITVDPVVLDGSSGKGVALELTIRVSVDVSDYRRAELPEITEILVGLLMRGDELVQRMLRDRG